MIENNKNKNKEVIENDEKNLFEPAKRVYVRKHRTSEVLCRINEMIQQDAKKRQTKGVKFKDHDDAKDGQERGKQRYRGCGYHLETI